MPRPGRPTTIGCARGCRAAARCPLSQTPFNPAALASSPAWLTGLGRGDDVDLPGLGRGLLRRGRGRRLGEGELVGWFGGRLKSLAVTPALLRRVGGDLGGQFLPAFFPFGDVPAAGAHVRDG